MCFYDIGIDGMVTHGKELLIRFPVSCQEKIMIESGTRSTFIIVDCMLR